MHSRVSGNIVFSIPSQMKPAHPYCEADGKIQLQSQVFIQAHPESLAPVIPFVGFSVLRDLFIYLFIQIFIESPCVYARY